MFYIWNGIKFILMLVFSIVVFIGFVAWDIIHFISLMIWKTLKTLSQFIIGAVEIIWNTLLCGLYDSVSGVINFLSNYTNNVNKQFEIRHMKKTRQKIKAERQELKNEITKIKTGQEI